jgi:NAD(P)-dependent dehydrogenase (short-subunit alcohol dehydrogenase family)
VFHFLPHIVFFGAIQAFFIGMLGEDIGSIHTQVRNLPIVMMSKSVQAPGPGAASYSASKAALNQLAPVAALEWGMDSICINSLHPNAVICGGS